MLTIKAKYHIQEEIWNFIMKASENDRNIRKDDIPPPCSVEELQCERKDRWSEDGVGDRTLAVIHRENRENWVSR